MRELWWTYSVYVWSSHVFFSVLTLGFGEWLMSGSSSAIAMNTFMLLWWSVRLWLQFFGFDLSDVTKDRFNRIAKNLLTLLFIGLCGSWVAAKFEWQNIILMFLPLSIGFHFGVLRILKGTLRVFGFPVRTLFPNPLETHGISDFWSRRWNIGYSQMMQRLVGRPIESIAGKSAGVMAVFFISGLLHEVAITLPVMSGFGLPTLYFTAHGFLTLLEKKWNRPLGKIPTLICVILPMGCLFPEKFQIQIIAKCLSVFN